MISPARKLANLQKSARRRGLVCTLKVARVADLLSKTHCPLCRSAFDATHPFSVDRINPLGGYTTNNVRACCEPCNQRKGSVDALAHALEKRDRAIRSAVQKRSNTRTRRGRASRKDP